MKRHAGKAHIHKAVGVVLEGVDAGFVAYDAANARYFALNVVFFVIVYAEQRLFVHAARVHNEGVKRT